MKEKMSWLQRPERCFKIVTMSASLGEVDTRHSPKQVSPHVEPDPAGRRKTRVYPLRSSTHLARTSVA